MSPEGWKTYWRTCHLTLFQVQEMEVKAFLKRRQDAAQAEIDKIISEKAAELTDRMELQMMGIRP